MNNKELANYIIENKHESEDSVSIAEAYLLLLDKYEEASDKLSDGREYLMGVPSEDITVEDALESFGFGRNGLNF